VALWLRIPKSTLCKLCQEGQIPATKIGRHWRFDRTVVQNWFTRRMGSVPHDPSGQGRRARAATLGGGSGLRFRALARPIGWFVHDIVEVFVDLRCIS